MPALCRSELPVVNVGFDFCFQLGTVSIQAGYIYFADHAVIVDIEGDLELCFQLRVVHQYLTIDVVEFRRVLIYHLAYLCIGAPGLSGIVARNGDIAEGNGHIADWGYVLSAG